MTVTNIVAYEGLIAYSLGLILKEHAPLFVPAANLRIHINGTMQRSPYWKEGFEEWIDSLRESKGKDEVFAILAHEGDAEKPAYRYIGHTGIHGIKWPDGTGTTGSMIVEPSLQGKGAGTEAKLLLLFHCFFVLGLNNVKSTVKAWNAKSIKHLLKCGYRIIGRYEKTVFHEGRHVDEILLQVSRKDFEPIWEQYQATKQLPKLTPEQIALVEKETNA